MTDQALPSSFRDPSGALFERDGVLYRRVNPVYQAEYARLMDSGLYADLVAKGLLIPHEEVELPGADVPKVLRPERVPFISYPYEWCFHQLQDAALATLRIQRRALKFGMSLKDASAYNIQFVWGKPLLIDTLSFETYREGEPWVAYRQFCQHFLAPLALMSYRDVRAGQFLRLHMDGIPLDLAAGLLPWSSRLRPGLLVHVHWHAGAQARHANRPQDLRTARGALSRQALLGLLDSLSGAVKGLRWEPRGSAWSDYYEDNTYTDEAMAHKLQVVGEYLEVSAPATVWDLGANTGRFSRMAADRGAHTIAFDVDPACIDILYREQAKQGGSRVLPLVMDVTNPSPGLGWAHRERASLIDRGPADTVLALALVHHLAIANNVPLAMIADFLARLCRDLIVEFVPKSDPQVQRLLASRQDVFPTYTEEGLREAFGRAFTTLRREQLRGSDRALYLMRRR